MKATPLSLSALTLAFAGALWRPSGGRAASRRA